MKIQPVYCEQRDFNVTPSYNYTDSIAEKVSYFRSPGKLTRTKSIKRTGINAYSSNRWYRWTTVEVDSVRLSSAGKFIVCGRYEKSWAGGFKWYSLEQDDHWKGFFKDEFGSDFSFATIHPLAPYYDITSGPIAKGFSPSLKEANLRDQVASLFGKTRCRRDLMRAVAQSHPNAIMLARDFRGLVPVDWLVNFLQRHDRNLLNAGPIFQYSMRPMLYQIDPRSYRDLLRQTLQGDDWYEINDVAAVWDQRARRYNRDIEGFGGRYRSFYEIHNAFFEYRRNSYRTPITPQPVPATPLSETLSTIPGVVIPSMTSDLVEWGNEMRNCIGSYAHSVTHPKRSRELGGIYEGERLIGNFEIVDGRLSQLLGKCNTPLPVGVRSTYEGHFKKAGVKIPANYWGNRDMA